MHIWKDKQESCKLMWIQWPGTSDPKDYKALADTNAQCTLLSSRYLGAKSISISGVTRGSQQLTTGSWSEPDWEQMAKTHHCGWCRGPVHPWHRLYLWKYLRKSHFRDPKGHRCVLGELPWRQRKLENWTSCLASQGILLQ